MNAKNPHSSINYQLDERADHSGSRVEIEPLFNEAFIRIFGREQSKGITRSLINAVLEEVHIDPIDAIDRIAADHTSAEGGIECKTPRFDVHVVSEARHIDLEAQRYPSEVENRAVYYAANSLTAATSKIKSYSELPQAIVITLLDDPSPFPASKNYVHVCRWCWNLDGKTVEATDRQLIILVELSKVRERYNGLNGDVLESKLLSWSYLITNGFRNEREVQSIVDSYPDIEEFAELYGLAVNDPKVVQAYQDAKSAVLEYNNRQEYFAKLEREASERGEKAGMEKGLQKGLAEGLEKGMAEGLKEGLTQGRQQESDRIAANLRSLGLDEELIRKAIVDNSE